MSPYLRYLLYGVLSSASLVSSLHAQKAATIKKPTIVKPVKDKQNPITGSAQASTDGSSVQVQLLVKTSANGDFEDRGAPETVGKDGSFTLHVTVNQGETIEVQETGANLPTDGSGSSDPVLVVAADNEREHIDFLAGTVLSQSESNFGQADTFLALNVDRAIYRPGFYRATDTCEAGAEGATEHKSKSKQPGNGFCSPSRRPGMNTFFQARLTTIPVNASTTTTTTASTSGTSATTTPATPSLSSVITSQKTGHFEGGIYFPFAFGRVPMHTKDPKTQTFYIAPIYRFGFNTLAASPQTTSTMSTASNSTTTTTSTPTALGTTSPLPTSYNFFTMGTRIGTASIEPGSLHNIHYLDITVGKFSNLENLYCPVGSSYMACAATSNTAAIPENRYRPFRLSFEGYYQVPVTGFILGMSANVGTGVFDRHANTDINQRAATDLRFLFGYKFDVNKLFKALPTLTQ